MENLTTEKQFNKPSSTFALFNQGKSGQVQTDPNLSP